MPKRSCECVKQIHITCALYASHAWWVHNSCGCNEVKWVLFCWKRFTLGWELNSAASLASQPVAGHSLSFIITIGIMTLSWGLFVGLATESCGRIWLQCLSCYIKQIMNVFAFVQWNKYFHSVKDEMFHSTRLRLDEWNISSLTSWNICTIALINIHYLYNINQDIACNWFIF